MATKIKTRKFDPAKYLTTPEAIAAFLEDAFESGDATVIAEALGVVARASGMADVARALPSVAWRRRERVRDNLKCNNAPKGAAPLNRAQA